MRVLLFVLGALALAGCESGKVSLDSAMKKAREGNFDLAISQYQQLIANDPNDPMYHNNLGWTFFRNGQFAEAKHHVQKAAELDSDGKLADAIALNSEMIARYDSIRDTICVDLNDQTGIAYFSNEENFEVHFGYSAYEIGYFLVAECYQSLNDPEKADLAYEKLLDLYKDKKFDSTIRSKALSMLSRS